MTHTQSVRRITLHSFTLVENGLTVSDKLVLLPWENSLTERDSVRQTGKIVARPPRPRLARSLATGSCDTRYNSQKKHNYGKL